MTQLNIQIPPGLKSRYKIVAERLNGKITDRKITLKSLISETLEKNIDDLEKYADEIDQMY